jgi:hypothetical protein
VYILTAKPRTVSAEPREPATVGKANEDRRRESTCDLSLAADQCSDRSN